MIPEKDDGKDFDDCQLVVVPDDVSDGFQRVQEPHERGIRTTEENKILFVSKF